MASRSAPSNWNALAQCFESSAFAVWLRSNPGEHGRYRAGRLSSTNAISHAVRNLGAVGQDLVKLWGELSKHFAHIGPFYRRLLTWHIDIRGDKLPLQIVLFDLKWSFYLLEVCTEFCLYDSITDHRYWEKIGSDLIFRPNVEAENWITDFMEKDLTAIQEAVRDAKP